MNGLYIDKGNIYLYIFIFIFIFAGLVSLWKGTFDLRDKTNLVYLKGKIIDYVIDYDEGRKKYQSIYQFEYDGQIMELVSNSYSNRIPFMGDMDIIVYNTRTDLYYLKKDINIYKLCGLILLAVGIGIIYLVLTY